jgi:hypothetical protein
MLTAVENTELLKQLDPLVAPPGVVERLLDFAGDPQVVKQHRKFASYRHYGAFSSILGCCAPSDLDEPVAPEVRVSCEGAKDV